MSAWWDQSPADVRIADGPADLAATAAGAGTIVVVDVLSFSTCVSVAVTHGSTVLPLPWRDEPAASAAAAAGALLAGPRGGGGPSLSPPTLSELPPGTTLALPSPNGARAVLHAAEHAEVAVGCLRNAAATAAAVSAMPGPYLLVACGERWPDDRSRPALEDRLGCGLIARVLAAQGLSLSAEARAAAALASAGDVVGLVRDSASGRELSSSGFGADVDCAVAIDADPRAAVLRDGLLRRS